MELFIALRYLRGKRAFIGLISTVGVTLGCFVLVIALSISNGFEKEVRDRIVGTLAQGRVLLYHSSPILNYDSLVQVIRKHPDITAAAPYISGKGGVEVDETREGVLVMGVDARLQTEVTDLGKNIKFGAFNLDSASSKRDRKLPAIIIGQGLADKLGVRPGNEIVLMSLASVEGEIDPTPRMERFTCTGVFETGLYEYDINLVYISIPSAQDLFFGKGVEGIQIKTRDLYNADKICKDLEQYLGGYPYRTQDWKQQNRTLFEWMKLEKFVIFIVISLIMVVASFNIISSLVMQILEKRREIGILMSMGATSKAIMKVFMYNGMVVGFLGSTIGTAFGLLVCFIQYHWKFIPLPGDIYFISKLPILIIFTDVIAVYVTANLICWLVTLIPAWKASKVLPAESLRIE